MSAEGYQGAEAMGGGGGSPVSVTLAQAYANGAAGADSTFTLDVTRGGLVVDGSGATSVPPLLVKNGKTISGVELQVVGSAGTGLLLRDSSGVHQGGLGFAVTNADFEASTAAGDIVLYSLVGRLKIATQASAGVVINTGNASVVVNNSGGTQLKYSTSNVTVGTSTVTLTAGGTTVLNLTSAGVFGSSSASGNLNLGSTSNATKGFVYVGSSTGLAYDEINKRIGVNQATPDCVFQAGSTLGALAFLGAGSMPAVISLQAGAGTFPGILFGSGSAARGALYWDDGNGIQLTANTGVLNLNGTTATVITGTQVQAKPGGVLVLNLTTSGVFGTTGSGGNLLLGSTTNATKGQVQIGGSTGLVYDETTKRLGVGLSPTSAFHVSAANAEAFLKSTSTSQPADIQLQNSGSTANMTLAAYGSAVAGTVFGVNFASACGVFSTAGSAPLVIGTLVSADIVFGTLSAATAERMRIDAAGNVSVGSAALATGATDGFLYVPSCAGAPTGAATSKTGLRPLVYDTTNNKLWFNTSGSTWKGVVFS
jgi:hypothetical protein